MSCSIRGAHSPGAWAVERLLRLGRASALPFPSPRAPRHRLARRAGVWTSRTISEWTRVGHPPQNWTSRRRIAATLLCLKRLQHCRSWFDCSPAKPPLRSTASPKQHHREHEI